MPNTEDTSGITEQKAPEQDQAPVSEQQGEPEAEDLSIPTKFVGKSSEEIVRAYVELEKLNGRIASERAQEKQEREELAARLQALESERVQSQQYQPTSAQPAAQQLDPLSVLDSKFDADPHAAIREALRLQAEQLTQAQKQARLQQQMQEAQSYYLKQKSDNPDFARREALMQRLVQEFGPLMNPDLAGSVTALKALDLMSKGMDVEYYERQAVERVKKEGLSKRDEKIASQVETSAPSQAEAKKFEDLSLEEMEKFLGFAKPE